MAGFIGGISGFSGLDSVNRKKSKQYSGSMSGFNVGASMDDGAEFSPFAVELARINSELKATPDVREEKVAAIKEQVETEKYVPALDQVARTLVMAGFLDTLIEE